MAITLAQALADVRQLLLDQGLGVFSDAVLTNWLSLGQQTVAGLSLCSQHRATYTHADSPAFFLEGLREYALASAVGGGGFHLPTAITPLDLYLNGQNLVQITSNMLPSNDARSNTGGTPNAWYTFGGFVGFVPYPDADFVATEWTLEVFYADMPGAWESGESVLASGFDDLLAYFTVLMVSVSRENWATFDTYLPLFTALLEDLRRLSVVQRATLREELSEPPRQERTERLPRAMGR